MQFKQTLKNQVSRARDGLVRFFARRDPVEYFIALMILGLTVFVVRCLIFGSEAFTEIFHLGTSDLFMDYFNSLRDGSRGAATYTERRVIYPPLANLLFWMMSRLVPDAYLNTPAGPEVHTWRLYNGAILSLVLFSVVSIVLLALAVKREQYTPAKQRLLTLLIVLSFPVIFMVERGNIVVLALVALIIFVQNYNSESRVQREVALLALAFAAALKLYPALFGLVMLVDKRYRDALRAAAYTILLLLVPSFFFGGPVAIFYTFINTFSFSTSGQNATNFMTYFGLSATAGTVILVTFYLVEVGFLVLSSLVQKKAWKTWMFAGAVLLTFSSIFSSYNWLLLLPAILTFLRTERLEGMNWVYFFLMTLPFYVYIPKPWQDPGLIALLAGMIALSVIESVRLFIAFFKNRKAEVEPAA